MANQLQLQWHEVRDSWHKAQIFTRSLISSIIRPVSVEVLSTRRVSCFGDDQNKPCQQLKFTNGHYYCGACGCPSNSLARLDTDLTFSKLHYPYLECPLEKPGFSNHREEASHG